MIERDERFSNTTPLSLADVLKAKRILSGAHLATGAQERIALAELAKIDRRIDDIIIRGLGRGARVQELLSDNPFRWRFR